MNPSARRGAKPSSHQTLSTSTRARSRSIRGSIRPTKLAEGDREYVIAPPALGWREKALPHVLEVEQAREEGGVPQQRVEWGDERDGGGRLRRRLQQRELLGEAEALATHALDVDGHERAELDHLLAQFV